MTNLLTETIEDIRQSGHEPKDIVFIGSENSGHSCTWDEFTVLANIEYYNGFGAQEVASDLIVVFSDGAQMWRDEYDGSEKWAYSSPFTMPAETKPIKRLIAQDVGWSSLADMQNDVY